MVKTVFEPKTGLSRVDTGMSKLFMHCGTPFTGQKCPDCGEHFTEEDLVLTIETAERVWALNLGEEAPAPVVAASEIVDSTPVGNDEPTPDAEAPAPKKGKKG